MSQSPLIYCHRVLWYIVSESSDILSHSPLIYCHRVPWYIVTESLDILSQIPLIYCHRVPWSIVTESPDILSQSPPIYCHRVPWSIVTESPGLLQTQTGVTRGSLDPVLSPDILSQTGVTRGSLEPVLSPDILSQTGVTRGSLEPVFLTYIHTSRKVWRYQRGNQKKNKKTNNCWQYRIQKTKDWATWITLKSGVNEGRVGRSCSTSLFVLKYFLLNFHN